MIHDMTLNLSIWYDDHCNTYIYAFKDVKKPTKKLQSKYPKCATHKKMTDSLLPRPFKLPKKFPKFVNKEISTGMLSGKARTRLIFTVANAVFDYTAYPSKEEYDHVARQIVKRYQFMSDDKGSHVSC